MNILTVSAIFVFFRFFELQASHRAENLTTERSRCPRFFVLCMGAPAWPKNFEKTSRKSFFPIFFATDGTAKIFYAAEKNLLFC